MFKRKQFNELKERIEEPRNKIQVISGPRQVLYEERSALERYVKDSIIAPAIERDIPIEVKSGRRTTNNGMKVFAQRFTPLHTLVVGSGGIPIEEFLSADLEALLED